MSMLAVGAALVLLGGVLLNAARNPPAGDIGFAIIIVGAAVFVWGAITMAVSAS